MVGILTDKKYANSLWCKNLHQSLSQRLRQKRIPFCEISDTLSSDIETVFIISTDLEWVKSVIKQLNDEGVIPILLCNQTENLPGCIYNCVCSDINASMKNLLDVLKEKQKRSIAIYGINPNSIADISRADSLMQWKNNYSIKMKIFINHGSLKSCFDDFYSQISDFDAVICSNNFAAISLVNSIKEKCPQLIDSISIISCTSSKISEYYSDNILSLDINYEQYGKAAVYIYEAMKKHSYLSGLTVKLVWNLIDSHIPKNKNSANVKLTVNLTFTESDDTFYNDPEIGEMLIVDKLLTLSDNTDKEILCMLLEENISYEEISQKCFLSENTIKYRIKKLINSSGAKDKTQIIYLLKKYIK